MNLLKILTTIVLMNISIFGQTSWLNVKIVGIDEIKGKIAIALFNSAENFPEQRGENPHSFVEVKSDSVEYTFENLINGTYAIAVYHDENDNGEMDTNFLGIPTEDYVFSNHATGSFGPPSFEDASFSFKDSLTIILDINK